MAATCETCSLYIEQTHSLEKFARIEGHPCAHVHFPIPDTLGVRSSHSTYNLGKLWICTKCYAILTPGFSKLSLVLQNPCEPNRKKKPPEVAKFLPRDSQGVPSVISFKKKPTTEQKWPEEPQPKICQFFAAQGSEDMAVSSMHRQSALSFPRAPGSCPASRASSAPPPASRPLARPPDPLPDPASPPPVECPPQPFAHGRRECSAVTPDLQPQDVVSTPVRCASLPPSRDVVSTPVLPKGKAKGKAKPRSKTPKTSSAPGSGTQAGLAAFWK